MTLWIEWAGETEERITLCCRRQLFGVVEGLNRCLKKHLTAAREQKAIGWLSDAIAGFGPCVRARKLRRSILRDCQLRCANAVGLYECLHCVIKSRKGGDRRAGDRPFPA